MRCRGSPLHGPHGSTEPPCLWAFYRDDGGPRGLPTPPHVLQWRLWGLRGRPRLGPRRLGASLGASRPQRQLFPTEPLRLAFNLIRGTSNPPVRFGGRLGLAGLRGSDSCSSHGPPRGPPWHLVQTEVVRAARGWSHLFPASPLPRPPGHWPRPRLSTLPQQGLQGGKPGKDLAEEQGRGRGPPRDPSVTRAPGERVRSQEPACDVCPTSRGSDRAGPGCADTQNSGDVSSDVDGGQAAAASLEGRNSNVLA